MLQSNSYLELLNNFEAAFLSGSNLALLKPKEPPRQVTHNPLNGVILVFAPHPDDEALVGLLARRLELETGMRVVVVSVTLGSDKERRQPRLEELQNACGWMGWKLEALKLEKITLAEKESAPDNWACAVEAVGDVIYNYDVRLIVMPNPNDHHITHIGTYHLVVDALRTCPDFECHVALSEYWGMLQCMLTPNLMVQASITDAAELLGMLWHHQGELDGRIRYDQTFPAEMMTAVRRGSELLMGKGAHGVRITFATLYRMCKWSNGLLQPATQPLVITSQTDASAVFEQ